MTFDDLRTLAEDGLDKWSESDAGHHAAAVAYYVWLAALPLLIIFIGIGGYFLDTAEARQNIVQHVEETVSSGAADMMRQLLESTYNSSGNTSMIATIIAVGTLLFLASYLYIHLRKTLNDIWNTEEPQDKGLMQEALERVVSAIAVIFTSALLLVMFLLDIFLPSILQDFGLSDVVNGLVEMLVLVSNFAILALLFGLIYRYVPRAHVEWNDVWIGALATSFAVLVGQAVIMIYFQFSTVTSAYGIAGTALTILLWVYYTMLTVVGGAVFTYLYAHRFGSLVPSLDSGASQQPKMAMESGYATG